MDPLTVLNEPTNDLEELVDQAERKLESAPPAARERFEKVVMPRVEEARKLLAQQSSRAHQAIEDVLVLLRELVTTAPQTGPEHT